MRGAVAQPGGRAGVGELRKEEEEEEEGLSLGPRSHRVPRGKFDSPVLCPCSSVAPAPQ